MSQAHILTKRELLELVWTKPMTSLAADFGLSPNGLAKICDRLNVERPPKGYWTSGETRDLAELTQSLDDPDETVIIGGGQRMTSRRSRTRMSLEDRQAQMLAEARQIGTSRGLHEVSLRSIARNLGISEAQAHNCFPTREDLLAELANEELDAFETVRQESIRRGSARFTKTIQSSVNYLRECATRGPLLGQILADSRIRQMVRQRRKDISEASLRRHVKVVMTDSPASQDEAMARTLMIQAMIRRTGDLIANRYITLQEGERICIPVVMESMINSSAPGELGRLSRNMSAPQ